VGGPPLHEFLERGRRSVDLDAVGDLVATHHAVRVDVDDEGVEGVAVQDEVAHGVFRGVRDGRDGQLDPEGLAADRAPALGLERDEPVVDLFLRDVEHRDRKMLDCHLMNKNTEY